MENFDPVPINLPRTMIAGITTRKSGNAGASGKDGTIIRNGLLDSWKILPVASVTQVHSLRILVLRRTYGQKTDVMTEGQTPFNSDRQISEGQTPLSGIQAYVLEGRWNNAELETSQSDSSSVSFPNTQELLEYISEVEADGIISNLDMGMGVTVADCGPILLAAESSQGLVCGALHSGWKGTGILELAINELIKNWEIPPNKIQAWLGPCISVSSYEVDQSRYDLFTARFGSSCGEIRYDQDTRYFINIKKANELIAQSSGVNLIVDPRCTLLDDGLLSYRGQKSSDFKRMLAFIGYYR
jgi:copper oxidase (laccase) domain-containing protein